MPIGGDEAGGLGDGSPQRDPGTEPGRGSGQRSRQKLQDIHFRA